MAGRKQHFIPQLLSRGFAATKTRKGKVQVWLYQRDREPVLVGTNGLFAQRDFYGSAPSELDETITGKEGQLKAVVAELRDGLGPGLHQIGMNPAIAELMRLSSTRHRWIRTMFEEVGAGTIDAAIEQTKDERAVMDVLKKLIAEEPDYLRNSIEQMFEEQVGRRLTSLEQQVAVLVAEYAERNLDAFMHVFNPAQLHDQLRDFRPRLKEAAAAGHQLGLAKSLEGSDYGRYLEKFIWYVLVENERLYVLGDCGPLYLDRERTSWDPLEWLIGRRCRPLQCRSPNHSCWSESWNSFRDRLTRTRSMRRLRRGASMRLWHRGGRTTVSCCSQR